jgi:hypothetical protein
MKLLNECGPSHKDSIVTIIDSFDTAKQEGRKLTLRRHGCCLLLETLKESTCQRIVSQSQNALAKRYVFALIERGPTNAYPVKTG